VNQMKWRNRGERRGEAEGGDEEEGTKKTKCEQNGVSL
jgi:hypothetical protein